VRALDTPVLLAILHGTPGARKLLRDLRHEEIATTELNLYELGTLFARAPKTTVTARRSAIARLRRRITVLPVTADGVREAGRGAGERHHNLGYLPLIWGTLVAAGCREWISTRQYLPSSGRWPFRLNVFDT
jgi:predicted nucleic acid-binding protein